MSLCHFLGDQRCALNVLFAESCDSSAGVHPPATPHMWTEHLLSVRRSVLRDGSARGRPGNRSPSARALAGGLAWAPVVYHRDVCGIDSVGASAAPEGLVGPQAGAGGGRAWGLLGAPPADISPPAGVPDHAPPLCAGRPRAWAGSCWHAWERLFLGQEVRRVRAAGCALAECLALRQDLGGWFMSRKANLAHKGFVFFLHRQLPRMERWWISTEKWCP